MIAVSAGVVGMFVTAGVALVLGLETSNIRRIGMLCIFAALIMVGTRG